MNPFSLNWIRSKKPGKQRKYRQNAPSHTKRKFLNAPLSKELKEKYKRRSIPLRKGDKVKIMTGQFKSKEGKINRVDVERTLIYVDGVAFQKTDGNTIPNPINPSNVMITELNTGDKRRLRNEKSS